MANIILFTDRTPVIQQIDGEDYQLERLSRPAGAYKVASTLRAKGYSVIVVPNCLRLSLAGIKNFIRANSKDLIWVGISSTFLTVRSHTLDDYKAKWKETAETTVDLEILKNKYYQVGYSAPTMLAWGTEEMRLIAEFIEGYNAKLLLGGGWVTHIKNGSIDIERAKVHVVTGQSEDYITELTDQLAKDQTILPQNFRDGQLEFKSSFIDYTQADYVDSNEWLALEISRGCAFKCAYCSYDHKGKADTTKFTKTLRDEILRNYEMFGVTKYHLLDDLYNDSDYKIKLLYDEVWSKLPFKPEWISYLRLDLIWSNKESAKWIEASGCRLGAFGIETLHDQAGKKVGKGLGKERILETLEYLKETWDNRVLVTAFMIAGLPYEPYEHIVETMDWIRNTDLIHSYKYIPLWVTPPEHKTIMLKTNSLSENYEKYQIEWGPDGWINNMGVTHKMVNELVMKDTTDYFDKVFPVDLNEYPELRALGWTHEQLADKSNNHLIIDAIKNQKYNINDKISYRLNEILKTTD
jgi:hypothetical protein